MTPSIAMDRHRQEFSLCSVGDISFTGGFFRTHPQPEAWLSDDVRQLLDGDVNLANLECVLVRALPSEMGDTLYLAEPAAAPLAALKYAGINVVSLANNHVMDLGVAGFREMVELLDHHGIRHFGAGIDEVDACRPLIIDDKGVRLAFLGRLHAPSFVHAGSIAASTDRPGVAIFDEEEVMTMAAACKRRWDADRVILCVHWGIQGNPFCDPAVHDAACRLISGAVDVILGHGHLPISPKAP